MTLHRTADGWVFVVDGELRVLKDPDAPATSRQLIWLNSHGLLGLRALHGGPLTKLDAARAIDELKEDGA